MYADLGENVFAFLVWSINPERIYPRESGRISPSFIYPICEEYILGFHSPHGEDIVQLPVHLAPKARCIRDSQFVPNPKSLHTKMKAVVAMPTLS